VRFEVSRLAIAYELGTTLGDVFAAAES